MRIWNLEMARVSEELKQGFVDNFFSLMCDSKKNLNVIYRKYSKYKIEHPQCDIAVVDRGEVLEEILYSYYIENRMMVVAATIGNFNFMENAFR